MVDPTEPLTRRLANRGARAGVAIWLSRGGGMYGIGYLLTFVILQVRSTVEELSAIGGGDDIVGFVVGQLLEHVLRIGLDTMLNALHAFLWPLLAIDWIGGVWGVLAVVAAFVLFDQVAQPWIERRVPWLRDARERHAADRKQRARKD